MFPESYAEGANPSAFFYPRTKNVAQGPAYVCKWDGRL